MNHRHQEGQSRLHPIGVVAERTGLTLDVLRVWERRYAVVEPTRDDAGRRLYTDEDIERLRLLARATAGGRTISQVASLPTEGLRALVREDESARIAVRQPAAAAVETAPLVAEAFERVRALDGPGLEAALTRAGAILGMSEFLEAVLGPLFRRIGDEWHAGRLRVAHEHLATAVAAPLVSRLGRRLPAPSGAPGLVVATPAGERHEIGALMVAGTAAVEGWRVTYLGPDVPAKDLAESAAQTGARAVALSSIHSGDPDSLAREVAVLRTLLPAGVAVLVGGRGAASLDAVAGAADIVRLAELSELRAWLRAGSHAVAT